MSLQNDQLLTRMGYLVEITKRRHEQEVRLGKTAMLKLLFLLQEVYHVPLGYRFTLYTYGPYTTSVMRDIDYARATDLLKVDYDQDQGYQISPGPQASDVDKYQKQANEQSKEQLDQLMNVFGDLNARDLEIRSTLAWIVGQDPEINDENLLQSAHKIKPQFSEEEINQAINHLKINDCLNLIHKHQPA